MEIDARELLRKINDRRRWLKVYAQVHPKKGEIKLKELYYLEIMVRTLVAEKHKKTEDMPIYPIDLNLFDKEEIHENCTVQVLTNTFTGEVSVGWWENGKR